MKGQLTVVAHLRAAKGKGDALAALLTEQCGVILRSEPGCLVYRVHRGTDDPDVFCFYEAYADDAALDAQSGQDKFKGSPIELRTLMVLYPNVMHVVTIDGTGINSMADMKGKRVSTGSPGSAGAVDSSLTTNRSRPSGSTTRT